MHTTCRIREDVARATVAFLSQGNSQHASSFSKVIARSVYESPTNSRWSSGLGHHLIAWGSLTPQQVVDDLLHLRDSVGGAIKAHDRTLAYVLMCWEHMLMGLDEPPMRSAGNTVEM